VVFKKRFKDGEMTEFGAGTYFRVRMGGDEAGQVEVVFL